MLRNSPGHLLPHRLAHVVAEADGAIGGLAVGEEDAPAIVGHLHVVEVRPAVGLDADRRAQVDVVRLEALRAHLLPPVDEVRLPRSSARWSFLSSERSTLFGIRSLLTTHDVHLGSPPVELGGARACRTESARRARRPRWGAGRSSSARPTGGRRSSSPSSRGRRSAGSPPCPSARRATGSRAPRWRCGPRRPSRCRRRERDEAEPSSAPRASSGRRTAPGATLRDRRIGQEARLQARQAVAHRIGPVHRGEFEAAARDVALRRRACRRGRRRTRVRGACRRSRSPARPARPALREVTSMRLSTRFQYCLTSLTSRAPCWLRESRRGETGASPCDLNTSIAISSSLKRRCEERVVELARACSGQNVRALRDHAVDIGRRRGAVRRLDRDGGDARGAVDVDADEACSDRASVALRARAASARCPGLNALRFEAAANSLGALGDLAFDFAVRHDLVDQPPLHRALALDAFLDGAEDVGMVAAHLALVDHAREPAGARQHRRAAALRAAPPRRRRRRRA
jgi:hypothetical protein